MQNGVDVEEEEDEDEIEMDDTDEHEEKVNTTNESVGHIDWAQTETFLVGEVVEVESTQVSFDDDEELNENNHSDGANMMDQRHIESPIKNSDTNHSVERPIEDDGLALDDELEEGIHCQQSPDISFAIHAFFFVCFQYLI